MTPTLAPRAAGATLSARGFARIAEFFQRVSGIRLTPAKHALVVGRLQKLAADAGDDDLDAFVERLVRGELPPEEVTRVVDRLTTNETTFFREPAHFEHFGELLSQRPRHPWRVWSGASSSGEEIYSLAMLMAEILGLRGGPDWQIVGTDLSTAMVATARRAVYPLGRAEGIPPEYLKRYCLKGGGAWEGTLLIDRALRERARFETLNLMEPLPDSLGRFDAIWLRNVLIYFETEPKAQIVRRVISCLQPGGVLYTGHAESLANLGLPLRSVAPAVYAPA
jgi:chemotaxis protein methyltransferase CheR